MKKSLFLLFLALVSMSRLQAQEATSATQITSSDQLVADKTYFITSYTSKTKKYYCDFLFERTEDEANLYIMRSEDVFIQPINAASESDLLTLKNIDGNWYLYSIQYHGYLGPDTITFLNLALLSSTPERSNTITFEDGPNGLALHFGDGSYLWFNSSVRRYQFGKANSNRLPVKLFLIKKEQNLLLDDSGLNGPINEKTNVEWVHTFKDNYYNTLCVPFDIPNYHTVFGSEVKAYKLNAIEGNSISFTMVTDQETLSANTPYLLSGVFDQKDTINFSEINVHTDSLTTPIFGNDTISLQGCYKPIDLSLKPYDFVLYKDQFICCSNQQKISLLPFHWSVRMNFKDPAKFPRLNFVNHTPKAPFASEIKKSFSTCTSQKNLYPSETAN